MMEIRSIIASDLPEMHRIYSYYVENTAVTFEYDAPSFQEFSRRIAVVQEKYPILVAISDGVVLGYAYASIFRPRPAYDWSVETTIYLHPEAKGGGIGRALYAKLEEILALQNVHNLNACIAYPEIADEYLTDASVRFHEKLGYRLIGKFTNSGFKSGKWYHMVWMEKVILQHEPSPKPFIPFPDLTV
ncbi:MAG: N-acetyltransferase family protein [Arcanobacterium sp.]|nr:N-acetyltransferase family protein [Arcanobacterium sp.]